MQLTPHLLIYAYTRGIFPMASSEDGEISWYDPDPRAILPLDAFHVPRRLVRIVRQGRFEVRVDTEFEAVMRACAASAPGRDSTWISEEMVTAYTGLHRLGIAHSVESWQNGELVGGLYGVGIRGLFAGESMFSSATDASKVALVHLVQRLRQSSYTLLDVQFATDHLMRFGAIEISREVYQARLAQALLADAKF